MAEIAPVPTFWITVFVIVAYLMGLACLALAFRIGSVGGWRRGLRELTLFVFFCGIGFFVESWAHSRAPYYVYAQEFPDLVPRINFDNIGLTPPPPNECSTSVSRRIHDMPAGHIPLTIPVLEGSLAFIALWASRLLGGSLLLRPLLAGLALFTVDALLDPIVATTYDCQGTLLRQGLGFWTWHINPAVIAQWHGIPLFNYAGWFGAAVLLVSLAYFIGWGLDLAWWGLPQLMGRDPAGERPPMHRGGLFALAVAAPVFVLQVAPTNNPPLWLQWLAIPGVIGGAAALVVLHARRFATEWEQLTDLTRACLLPLVFSVFALLVSGQFTRQPDFLFVAVMLTALGLLLTWWPYQSEVHRLAVAVVHLDRFIRLHYVAYPWLLVLLGAGLSMATWASLAPLVPQRLPAAEFPGLTLTVLLAVALAFQIYACVLNDVIDLEIDRTQIRRRNDPLVRGDIDRTTAHVFALLQLPVMLLLTQLVADGNRMPALLMAGASALMAVYNRFGKAWRLTPLTDFLQGASWGILALYGAALAGGALGTLAWIVFAYGTAFMTLINGIHGGLRDLANDIHHKRNNTARLLGARPSTDDPEQTTSTWSIVAFAFGIQTVMVGLLVWVLLRADLPYRLAWLEAPLTAGDPTYLWLRAAVIGAFVLATGWCHMLLWQLVRPQSSRRDHAGSMHAFAILLLPVIVFTPLLGPLFQTVVLLGFFLPLLLQYIDPIVGFVFPALRRRIADAVPTPRQAGERWSYSSDPFLTLVDEQGQALAPETRAVAHRGDGLLHLAFSIYLFDRDGRILLQQRSATKQLWPLYWSNSCCSHPRWGERTDEVAHRRLGEELNREAKLQEVFTFTYQARFESRGSEREHCTVFIGVADAVPTEIGPDGTTTFNRGEVAALKYLTPDQLDAELEQHPGEYTPWLRIAWARLRAHHWRAVETMLGSGRVAADASDVADPLGVRRRGGNGAGPHEGLVD